MGGPATSVVLPDPIPPEERARIAAVLPARGWSEDWSIVTDQPLGFSFSATGEPDWGWTDPLDGGEGDEGGDFAQVVGWRPEAEVVLASFVNSEDGHRAIADAAIEICESIGGLVNLCGEVDAPAVLPGLRFDLPYETIGGSPAVCMVVDADWLRAWRASPGFRMVK